MSINIPSIILDFKGQCVNTISYDDDTNILLIRCHRDKRFKPIDPISGQKGTINNYVRRIIYDIPLFACQCQIEIELAQVLTKGNKRRIELCEFVEKGCYYTRRFCRLIS